MLRIAVLDQSASSRQRILREIETFKECASSELAVLPRLEIRAVSLEELKLQDPPEICIIGDELLRENLREVSRIRAALPETILIGRLPKERASLALVEQGTRLGLNDVYRAPCDATDFIHRLVVLTRNKGKEERTGKLIIVDSAKGGVGVTTLAAALGEALSEGDHSVCLVDLDFESQSLSRFLQAKPFINENLGAALSSQRNVTLEFIEQALVPLGEKLFCMPPAPELEGLYDSRAPLVPGLVSVLEVLDSRFDCVVIDTGSARGKMLETLYHHADKVVYVLSNDPAAYHASASRLLKCKSLLTPTAELILVQNASWKGHLGESYFQDNLSRALGLHKRVFSAPIPFCRVGTRWPGSGGTLYSLSKEPTLRALGKLVSHLGLEPVGVEKEGVSSKMKLLLSRFVPSKPESVGGRPHDGESPAIALPFEKEEEHQSPSHRPAQGKVIRLPEEKRSLNEQTDENPEDSYLSEVTFSN